MVCQQNTADTVRGEYESHQYQQAGALTPSRRTAVRHHERRKEAPYVKQDADPARYDTHPHRHLRSVNTNVGCRAEDLSVDDEHGDVHRCHRADDVEP